MPLIGSPEDRSSHLHDAGGILPIQRHDIPSIDKHPFKSVAEAENLPTDFLGGAIDSAKDGIQAGAVASAREDTDALGSHRELKAVRSLYRAPLDSPVVVESPAALDQAQTLLLPIRSTEEHYNDAAGRRQNRVALMNHVRGMLRR